MPGYLGNLNRILIYQIEIARYLLDVGILPIKETTEMTCEHKKPIKYWYAENTRLEWCQDCGALRYDNDWKIPTIAALKEKMGGEA